MTASEPSLTLSMFYNGFSRIAFISAFAWVLNECLNKRGVFEAPFINLSKRISIVNVKQNDPETKPKTKVNNVTSSSMK
ncbi:unnamed protein product [Oppiella nova]|uniref:Uncharacterized protein n=1 Tax=Oppiella nova TaxID=334625 RepID=A0A7R9M9D8_9ACAR|nr:unnamed protein product [Oppiella nova]CAG2171900.1 unnamed protein product [Oppiella nova]